MSIPTDTDPITLFQQWHNEAKAEKSITEPDAMTLSTIDEAGWPNSRIVLLKELDARGFVFYTNLGSEKAANLRANPVAALCFHWMPLEKQVRVRGTVEPVTEEEADAYFASRPRQSQIGAWASKQSQELEGRLTLEKRVALYTAKFGVGAVPRPVFWSGFRIIPRNIEFWHKQPFRLHDRVLFTRDADTWTTRRLYP